MRTFINAPFYEKVMIYIVKTSDKLHTQTDIPLQSPSPAMIFDSYIQLSKDAGSALPTSFVAVDSPWLKCSKQFHFV